MKKHLFVSILCCSVFLLPMKSIAIVGFDRDNRNLYGLLYQKVTTNACSSKHVFVYTCCISGIIDI